MAMAMRAREETAMAVDFTPPIPPLAFALHDPFLSSHCSSCFRSISSQPPSLHRPCSSCSYPILYCSSHCSSSHSLLHSLSGECLLLTLASHGSPTADLRAALRLLALLSRYSTRSFGSIPTRIAGLLASDLDGVLTEGGEVAERIRDGAALMSRARNRMGEGVSMEELALWAVLTNAVEVQVADGAPVGIAVYGPRFSWFNHSCSPNACYRFNLWSRNEPGSGSCVSCLARVYPDGPEEDTAAWEAWHRSGDDLATGWCRYGPRVTVRSIKPVRKDEEVCIAYTDLLRPKAMRQSDLWSNYRFVCHCERCSGTPPKYVDYVLNVGDLQCCSRSSNTNHDDNMPEESEKLAAFFSQAVAEYMADEDPESCCRKLESVLSNGFRSQVSQADDQMERKLKLQPLHHLSLNAYVVLASAYRMRMVNLQAIHLGEEDSPQAVKIGMGAVAYSVLLAGAVNHLFSLNSSIIASAALYWVSAGDSIFDALRSSMWRSDKAAKQKDELEFRLDSVCQRCNTRDGSSVSWDEFKTSSTQFFKCISDILLASWTFLTKGSFYLENIKSPVDFSWLAMAHESPQVLTGASKAGELSEIELHGCHCKPNLGPEEVRMNLFRLMAHCLIYGRYLASICYGSGSHLAHRAEKILYSIGYACPDVDNAVFTVSHDNKQ